MTIEFVDIDAFPPPPASQIRERVQLLLLEALACEDVATALALSRAATALLTLLDEDMFDDDGPLSQARH